MELALTPTDHLSPPSTTSRLSDSDTSECDLEDGLSGVGARERRVADGASISSVGSSSRYVDTNYVYMNRIYRLKWKLHLMPYNLRILYNDIK